MDQVVSRVRCTEEVEWSPIIGALDIDVDILVRDQLNEAEVFLVCKILLVA